jgi:phosphatidylethanolamine/phosphatidyl-N-methylethanolamine N-methyltransferase
MDAAQLDFPNESFDVVYAPYLMSTVPDPVAVADEMCRVCRTSGRILVLNHILSHNPALAAFERLVTPVALRLGFDSALDLRALLAHTRLRPFSIARVNRPAIWFLLACARPPVH